MKLICKLKCEAFFGFVLFNVAYYLCEINTGIHTYTSDSGSGCGFRFEQKYWQINRFDAKRHRSADFHTPIHPSHYGYGYQKVILRDHLTALNVYTYM